MKTLPGQSVQEAAISSPWPQLSKHALLMYAEEGLSRILVVEVDWTSLKGLIS
jgi:hypothetical protein